MSEYHYVRTLGADGGVDRGEGQAIGLDLASVLEDGLPPWKIGCELAAGLCEIVEIATSEGQFHGEVSPDVIFVDETGAVSLEGYGLSGRRGVAPEGQRFGPATDLYGLGRTLFRIFSGRPLPPMPTRSEDVHDDAVIDAVLGLDLGGLPDEHQADLQYSLCRLLSFDPAKRPPAADCWRFFIALADGLPGPEMMSWCAASLDGGGERRSAGVNAPEPAARPAAPAAPVAPDLGGPVIKQGPLAAGAIAFDGPSSAGKGATAFWTRDQMRAALEAEEDAASGNAGAAAPRAAPIGAAATAFWTREQLAAEAAADAARPRRAQGEVEKRQATQMLRRPSKAKSERDDDDPPLAPQPVPAARSAPALQPPPSPPAAPRPPIAGPVVSGPVAPPVSPVRVDPLPPEPAPSGGTSPMLLVGVVVVLLVVGSLACLGLGGGAAVLAVLSGSSAPTTPARVEPAGSPPSPSPAPEADPRPEPAPAPSASPKPGTSPKPASPSPSPRSGSPAPTPKPSAPAPAPKPGTPSPSPAPSPKPAAPAPAPAPAGEPARVQFRTTGRGKIQGCRSQEFDGPVTLRFEPYEMPATCLVVMEGKRAVFQVYASGDITCNLSGSEVACDRSEVR